MTRDELQRLINLIVQELSAVPAARGQRCACHSVNADCCPSRLQGVIDAGATREARVVACQRAIGDILFVTDPLVADQHCLVEEQAGTFLLSDLGSRSGTFVRVTGDFSNEPIKAKIANAEHARVHTMLVLGPRDLEAGY